MPLPQLARTATLALLAASLGGAIAAEAEASAYKQIRKWEVSCSAGLTCTASFANWDNKGPRQFSLKRSNQPAAPVSLVFALPDGWTEEGGKNADKDGRYSVSVDGVALGTFPVPQLKGDYMGATLSDPAAVTAIIAAMQAGKTLRLDYDGAFGKQGLDVDLSGLSGSLIYLDEVQDRLDRTDALIRKGDRPAPEQAQLADIDSLDQVPQSIRGDFEPETATCGVMEGIERNFYGAFSVRLGEAELYVLPCGTGGAYNQPYALYLGYGETPERISFPDMAKEGPTVMSTAYNVDYDAATRTLSAFFKGRGIGDCGQYSEWTLYGGPDDNAYIVLKELRNKDDCDENNMGGPENFPLVWPKK